MHAVSGFLIPTAALWGLGRGEPKMDKTTEQILRRRMHGLCLSRKNPDLLQLSHQLLGMHCWFHRNVVFSALIRGAEVAGWERALVKTWVHHALHGVAFEDLPDLLALHADPRPLTDFEQQVLAAMEDGVCSRAEFRLLFAGRYDRQFVERAFSPWGGVFVGLAQKGLVAFRTMNSRDFDLISAEPRRAPQEVLPELLRRYFAAYGPATLADAAWFFGLQKEKKKLLQGVDLTQYSRLELEGDSYYYLEDGSDMEEIPSLTLLSGFDPYLVSYARRAALPPEYKPAVIMKSGICLPTVALDGRVAGVWNIKKGRPLVEFFRPQPQRVKNAAYELAEQICQRAPGI